ncbi:c-type cytochrome [Sulfurimonas sp.]|nr:c-type cytochrome [Sulfurimonas sp.]
MRFIYLLSLIFSLSVAQTSYEKGQALYLSKICYSCHGHKLEGMNTFPRLANRAKGYMAYKLKRFRSKKADTQAQEMMITYSVNLSDEDIENLTTFMYEYIDEESEERYDDSFQTHGDGGS